MRINRKNIILLLLFIVLALSPAVVVILGFNTRTPKDIPILMYHSINDTPVGEPTLSVTTKAFDEQMKYLASHGYTPIELKDIPNYTQYKKPVIVTFDDGYEDNYKNAYPILKKYNIKATVFMVSSYVNAGGFLTTDEIRTMGDLVSFQSHTVNHGRLDWLTPAQIDFECRVSQQKLSSITGKPVYAISYPNGGVSANVMKIGAKYYDYAVTTLAGKNWPDSNMHLLRRIGVTRLSTLAEFKERLRQTY